MLITGTYDVYLDGNAIGTLVITRLGLMNIFEFRSPQFFDVLRLVCFSNGSAVSIGIPAPEENGMYLKRSLSDGRLNEMGLSSIDDCIVVPVSDELSSLMPRKSAMDPPDDTSLKEPELSEKSKIPPKPPDTVITAPCSDEAIVKSEQEDIKKDVHPLLEEPVPSGIPGWYLAPEPASFLNDPALKAACSDVDGAIFSIDGQLTLLAFPFDPASPFPLIPAFRLGSALVIGGKNFIVYKLENGNPV